ncbi:heparinase, partial [Bacteroides ovatus]
MKQIVLCLIGILLASFVSAQKINHPSLLYTPQRIQQVKQRMQNEPTLKDPWEDTLNTLVESLQKKDFNRLDYLSLAYLMTDNKEYANIIKEILLKAVEAESWGDMEMMARIPVWRSQLGMAHKSFLSAIGYDAAYNIMSSSERKKIAEGLKRLAVEPALGDWLLEPARIHSLNSMGHNWWTSCVCQGGILALSLQNELPEVKDWVEQLHESLPEWFDFAGDALQQKAKSFDEAGGMYESLNYANFGIQEALLFRIAWINTHPGQNPGNIPQLAKLPNYFSQVCYPRTGMLYSLNFGDSHKNVSAESSMMLLYALGLKDPTILWYITQVEQGQHRDGFFLNRPMGFLYTPDLSKAPVTPNLKTSQLFSDFGWATMRTSWEKDATMLAVKSGHTWNHSHADANSFIVFHKGVDIIKDGGNCWYPNPAYRNYFFQSQAHNVVLFNGEGQPREQQYSGSTLRGNLYHLLDAGNVKYVLANGTGPVSNNFSRNFRHFLWMDNVIYMIDDLKTHKVGQFEWLWHTNGTYKKSGIDVNVTNGNSSVVIRPLYPRMLAKSDFVH